jgi:alpha-methylacyl-CoA racemase
VVDAAIVDGTASLMSFFYGLAQTGQISLERKDNLLGGSAPFYRTYLCADGKEVAVGALEPKFFGKLVAMLGLPEWASRQYDRSCWSELAAVLARTFATRNRDHWAELFARSDACVTPVLTCHEVGQHEHMAFRGIVANERGVCALPTVPAFQGARDAEVAERKAMSADQLLALWKDR